MDYYFDTHCHLNCPEFDSDRTEVVARADAANVKMLTIGTCLRSSIDCVRIAERFENVYAAVGIHPNDTAAADENDIYELRKLATESQKVIAIGEIGLDYFRDRSPVDTQKKFLTLQLELASELSLPVIIHARSSEDDIHDEIEDFISGGGKAVWHCFIASKKKLPRVLARSIEMGLYLGIGGMVTYEDQNPFRKIISQIPDKYLLLDTDSPFIIPRPRITDRNEPTGCLRIAEEIAKLRNVSQSDIARITTRNACEFLGLPLPYPQHVDSTIAYVIRNSLYLSLTNQCTNNCTFCARNDSYVVKGHDIRHDHEPEANEVIAAMGDTSGFDEIVFCGFGEPTMRLDVLKEVAKELKKRNKIVRLNTNGLANLHYQRDITPELFGLVDIISISLNTADPEHYRNICRPRFGEEAFNGLCHFVKACIAAGIKTICTVVDMPDIDVEAARKLTNELGAEFRVRSYVDAG